MLPSPVQDSSPPETLLVVTPESMAARKVSIIAFALNSASEPDARPAISNVIMELEQQTAVDRFERTMRDARRPTCERHWSKQFAAIAVLIVANDQIAGD
jgi:hypothetical protein